MMIEVNAVILFVVMQICGWQMGMWFANYTTAISDRRRKARD